MRNSGATVVQNANGLCVSGLRTFSSSAHPKSNKQIQPVGDLFGAKDNGLVDPNKEYKFGKGFTVKVGGENGAIIYDWQTLK